MRSSDFSYDLPNHLIAQTPAKKRDQSKLMITHRNSGNIEHSSFSNILNHLSKHCVLVLNNTKVFKARLYGKKSTGASIECLVLEPQPDGSWQCLAKPAKRLSVGDRIVFSEALSGTVVKKTTFVYIQFKYKGDFFELVNRLGTVPIPPYIHADDPNEFEERYQTTYAKHTGSVAAPTAGLHFTPDILTNLSRKGIPIEYLTLHVGYGTFKPMDTDNIFDHPMHYETYSIEPEVASRIQRYKSEGKQVIAVGTTTARALEAAFQTPQKPLYGTQKTNLFIAPGYQFKCIDGLITNFHLPKSSLLVLVSSFLGLEFTKKAYKEAILQQYRFYSFGDAMLIL